MRIIFTILFFCAYAANAGVNYYVDNGGNDGNAGTSPGAAWQHISKVNGFTFGTNDTINLNSNGSWNEKLIVPVGVAYVRSYNSGKKPIITGWQSITLTNAGGNVWNATATNAPPNLNTVLINGQIAHKARYPNSWYLFFSNTSTKNYLKTLTLTGTPNYAGAQAVVRTAPYMIDVSLVSSQHLDTLFLRDTLTYTPNNGTNGFFLQNLPSFLDSLNEYTYDSASKLLSVYSVGAPTVQYSNLDTAVNVYHKNNVVIDGIKFTGVNKYPIFLDSSQHCVIKNCSFDNIGEDAIEMKWADYTTISKDSLTNILNDAIYSKASKSNHVLVDSVYIQNDGVLEGMGLSGNSKYCSIFLYGDSCTATNNTVKNVGGTMTHFVGINHLIEYNYLDSGMLLVQDGGGLTLEPITLNNYGSIVRKNIVKNIIGRGESPTDPTGIAVGVYLDANTTGVLVDSNTVYNASLGSYFVNVPKSDTFRYNTSVSNRSAGFYYTLGGGNNVIVNHNIFYSGDSTQAVLYSAYYNENPGISYDYNYYLRPIKQTNLLKENSTVYSFPAWQATFPLWDAHSQLMPSGVTTATPSFYYNPTKNDSTITFSGTRIDALGATYTNSATIHPFQSLLLFTAININHRLVGSLKFD